LVASLFPSETLSPFGRLSEPKLWLTRRFALSVLALRDGFGELEVALTLRAGWCATVGNARDVSWDHVCPGCSRPPAHHQSGAKRRGRLFFNRPKPMCGIAGIAGCALGRDGLALALARMRDALAHRGPDGNGVWISGDGRDGLAHTRLAIIDPGDSAAQPMEAAGGGVLAFNGEIYNFRELGGGSGDTRVLAELLAAGGDPGQLAGMFAFGYFRDGLLLLARDSEGIKPLYYADTPRGFVFASEVRAVLASGLVDFAPDPSGAAAFFLTGSLPEPLTFARGVRCLEAGRVLRRDPAGAVRMESFRPPGVAEGVRDLRGALEESCRRHLVSDVPVGVFLSGGVDSVAVARLASLSGQVAEAFSLAFEEGEFSERGRIEAAAAAMGLRLNLCVLRADRARGLFREFLLAQDQPCIDGFNTFCISRMARDGGLRVVLSGVGGDELFGGYPTFRSVPRWTRAGRFVPGPAGAALARMIRALTRDGKALRVADWVGRAGGLGAAHRLARGIFSEPETRILCSHFGLGDARLPELRDPAEATHGSDCAAVAELETRGYLRNQLLRDSDVMSMANGLELRVPLVDARLRAFVESIDPDVRFAPGKAALRGAVPGFDAILPPGPKRGFTLPLQKWMEDSWEGWRELEPLARHIDLRHWSRKLAVISFANRLKP